MDELFNLFCEYCPDESLCHIEIYTDGSGGINDEDDIRDISWADIDDGITKLKKILGK